MPKLDRSIFDPGRNCWRLSRCRRFAVLIDGEEYFPAVRQAIAQAQRCVYIVGWDIDSRTQLVCDEAADDRPTRLGDLLHHALDENPALQIYILTWDFSVIYTFEREWQPLFTKPDWRHHRRLHFVMDGLHPVAASHHQKIVAIDDRIAFSGGFDLSKWRLDRHSHRPGEPCRRDPDGKAYPPFHDIQLLVEGEAAVRLAEICRYRWRLATGDKLKPPKVPAGTPWPEGIEPTASDIDVCIARTLPKYKKQGEVREVEQLYFDTIERARDYIYIENQYFTSTCLADAFERSLRQAKGPEIVLVLPVRTGGWLEQTTMDVIRGRLLERLVAADEHGRLRIYYPHIEALGEETLSLHSKLMIADNRLLRIGSANLSNRSMGLDTECDLAVLHDRDGRGENPATVILHRLLAEHLGCEPSAIRSRLDEHPSLIAAIESLDNEKRALKRLDFKADEELDRQLPDSELIDPERPLDGNKLMNSFIGPHQSEPLSRRIVSSLALILALFALAAAWRWSPLSDYLEPQQTAALLHDFSSHAWSPVAAVAGFVVASLVAVPVSFLIVLTGLLYGMTGFFYALAGSFIGACLSYYFGARLGRDTIRKMGRSSINRLSRHLARNGILTIIAVRIIPVAPFIVINLVAGASHIRFRDYLIGTLIGMSPGIFMFTVFADQLLAVVREADLESYLIFGAIVIVLAGSMFALRGWLEKRVGQN